LILDISIGLLLGVVIGFLIENGSITFIIAGGIFAVIADIDFFIHLFKNNWKVDEFAHEHRDLLHNPILFSLSGGIVFFVFLGWSWSLLWILTTIYHFIHDTLESGWGVRWLYPFSKKYLTLAPYSPKKVIKDKSEQRIIAAKYGDSNWIKEEAKFKLRLILEILFFITTIVVIWCIV
jgi:hypothetical protein